MPYLTNTFLFHIGENHFTGCKVIHPFFAAIEYSYQKERFIEVLNITISIKALGKLSTGGDNLTQEITEAARQHHAKNYSNPDDLAGVL